MKALYDLKDMLEDEIKKLTKKGELDIASVELAYKMVDIIKDIDEICGKEEMPEGYARGGEWSANGSYGYPNRVYDGNSYARMRDNRGRYMRGYSRTGAEEQTIKDLNRMLNEATDEKVRMAIQRSIDEING